MTQNITLQMNFSPFIQEFNISEHLLLFNLFYEILFVLIQFCLVLQSAFDVHLVETSLFEICFLNVSIPDIREF